MIAKEVTPELAVKYDEILRGKEQGTVELMTQIHVEAQSTLVKESFRQHVNTSFKETDRLEFYKKSIIEKLKKEGYWIVGTDMQGDNYCELKYDMPTCLIIGNEGKGMSKIVKNNCDYLVSIPMEGQIDSLNASVSCGIILSEIKRQRRNSE